MLRNILIKEIEMSAYIQIRTYMKIMKNKVNMELEYEKNCKLLYMYITFSIISLYSLSFVF